MELALLHEQVLPPGMPSIFGTLGPHVDDSNQLVAYRLRIHGRAQNYWFVNLRGQCLARIEKKDSRWVHDNWGFTYYYRMGMTRDNRPYLDTMLKQLMYKVWDAVKLKRADVVVLPIDISKL